MIRALLLALALAGPAAATSQEEVLAAAILPGWQTGTGQMAALRLTLSPGWKTYWRSPGDAGLPPRFDWTGSQNLGAVVVHWPAPSVFDTNGMQTIGYQQTLVLPIEIAARDPSLPISVAVQIELGICKDICIPASVTLAADLPQPGAADPAISAALDARAVSGREAGIGAYSCTLDPLKDGLRIVASLTLPRQGSVETVAFELADSAVWIAQAQSEREGEVLTAWTDLVPPEAAPFALDRAKLTITVISDTGAVEIQGCPAP